MNENFILKKNKIPHAKSTVLLHQNKMKKIIKYFPILCSSYQIFYEMSLSNRNKFKLIMYAKQPLTLVTMTELFLHSVRRRISFENILEP